MTSLLNTCRWFPAGIHKLDNNRRVYINAFELLHVIMEYCRFGNVRENFIFANIRECGVSRILSPR